MKNIIFYGIAMCLLFLVSCGKDTIKIDPIAKLDLQKIGEQVQGDTRIIVWGDKSVETGYEKLFFQFLDKSNSSIVNGKVNWYPLMEMDMNGHKNSHSSPADPAKLGENSLFESGAVFTMASDGEHGTWKLVINHTAPNKELSTFEVPIQVKANKEMRVKTISLENGDRYVLSFYLADVAKIGVNEANFTLHKRNSGTPVDQSFVAYKAANIKVDPRMPDMDDHGSPNNVNPTHKVDGHYAGKLNFTMSGLWRLHLDVTIDGETVKTSFDQKF